MLLPIFCLLISPMFAEQSMLSACESDASENCVSVNCECGKLLTEICDGQSCKNCEVRPEDEVWLISTRCLGCPLEESEPPKFEIQQYDISQKQWEKSSLEAYLKATSKNTMPTRYWVHGNRIDCNLAIDVGWMAYHCIVGCPSNKQLAKKQPTRVVFFSWPSDKIRGQVRDVREKRYRADTDGYYLGWLINKMSPKADVGIVGYSYGCLVGASALHLLGGGEVSGHTIPNLAKQKRRPLQAVFLAAAIGDDWLLSGGQYELALDQCEKLLILYNSCDPALKRFDIVTQCRGEQALGYTGLATHCLSNKNAKKVEQYDVRCIVGRKHDYLLYLYSPAICKITSQYVIKSHSPTLSKRTESKPEAAKIQAAQKQKPLLVSN